MKKSICTSILIFSMFNLKAQIVNPGAVLKRNAENRINQKIDNGVNKGLDKVEEGAKKKKQNTGTGSGEGTGSGPGESKPGKSNGSLVSYSKFDFVPGEKIIVAENFSDVATGDFPVNWNTNGSGEVVTVEGRNGKWLQLSKEGTFLQEAITTLPENFTYEFNVLCNEEFSYYSTALNLVFAELASPARDFNKWGIHRHPGNGLQLSFHPMDADSRRGTFGYIVYHDGTEQMKNTVASPNFHAKTANMVRVSIWRQKTRLRVYLNDEKVIDLPKAFETGVKYNSALFWLGGTHQASDKYLISDIRMAIGAPDTRNKLITEGKFVTRGILFNSGSDQIRPESYGTLKEIAGVMKENPDLNIRIIGHTDSDGDADANLKLSENRAIAIKKALEKEFGIAGSRMETLGKGETEPADKNDTPAGKANNRRVEFVKR